MALASEQPPDQRAEVAVTAAEIGDLAGIVESGAQQPRAQRVGIPPMVAPIAEVERGMRSVVGHGER
ncbi:MAG: hypothetical protein R3B99_06630 [Polyangiales bacterium]